MKRNFANTSQDQIKILLVFQISTNYKKKKNLFKSLMNRNLKIQILFKKQAFPGEDQEVQKIKVNTITHPFKEKHQAQQIVESLKNASIKIKKEPEISISMKDNFKVNIETKITHIKAAAFNQTSEKEFIEIDLHLRIIDKTVNHLDHHKIKLPIKKSMIIHHRLQNVNLNKSNPVNFPHNNNNKSHKKKIKTVKDNIHRIKRIIRFNNLHLLLLHLHHQLDI